MLSDFLVVRTRRWESHQSCPGDSEISDDVILRVFGNGNDPTCTARENPFPLRGFSVCCSYFFKPLVNHIVNSQHKRFIADPVQEIRIVIGWMKNVIVSSGNCWNFKDTVNQTNQCVLTKKISIREEFFIMKYPFVI